MESTSSHQEKIVENTQDTKPEQAYDEETGEINWDCPCLQGMTDPPCGEAFKAAFSCFVYSKEEPKGKECVEAFREMQDCFRRHPEIYSDDETSEPQEDVENKE